MTELYGGSDNVHSFCGAIQLFKVALQALFTIVR